MNTQLNFKFFILIFLVFFFTRCNNKVSDNKINRIGLFDISQDNHYLLFSCYQGSESSIYQIDTNGKSFKKIVPASTHTNFYNPKYSRRSQKLLFLGREKNSTSYQSAIYISDLNGSNIEKITDGKEIISEAIFSDCDNKIYYCQAGTYGHSSPLGQDQTHGVDVYSIDLKSRIIEKVSNFNAYNILHVSEYDCQNLLVYMPVPDKEGMTILSKSKPGVYRFIDPINHPRDNPAMYYAPVYSKQFNTLVFIATYELMQMNMSDKIAKVIVNQNIEGHSQINNIVLLRNQKRLVYTTNSETEFIMVNFDGSGIKHLKL